MFKTTKAKIIFVIIFSIICITITTFLVIYKNIDVEEPSGNVNEEIVEQNKEKDFPGIDLKGTYNQNDIKIEEKQIQKEKVHIDYCQINGLKDKNIQDKINKELEEIALNCYKEEIKDLNKVVNVNVTMWNSANFANTVSFCLNYYAKIDDDSDDMYNKNTGLNYDLNTGERIEFKKLFTSNAPMENILRKSSYYSVVKSKTEPNLNGEFVVDDYGEVEEEIAEIIMKYNNGSLTDFSYSSENITIYYSNNQYIDISMKEYSEYIAIYNRYLTENDLYENNNIGLKNIYTLSSRYPSYYYYMNYQNEQNYFIDINIMRYSEDEFSKKLLDDKIRKIEEEIENVKSLAISNPNNFYILNYSIDVYTGEDWQTKQTQTACHEVGNIYEMTVHDFEENIEPIIIEYNRNAFWGGELSNYVYYLQDMLKITPQEIFEYYNPYSGEKIVI